MSVALALKGAGVALKSMRHTVALWTKRHAPEILQWVGRGGMLVGTYMCCSETLKLPDILEAHEKIEEEIEAMHNGEYELEEGESYTESDYKKDLAKNRLGLIYDLVKLYGPGVLAELAGLGCDIAGGSMQKNRLADMTTLVGLLSTKLANYRSNVADEIGKEAEQKLYYGDYHENKKLAEAKSNKAKAAVMKPDKHPKLTCAKPIAGASVYARYFDESSHRWLPGQDYNLRNLDISRTAMNDRLRARGWLCLNDVYEDLGFEKTKVGQFMGWVFDDDNDHNYVDYMIDQFECNRDALNLDSNVTLLDFNVRPILDDIPDDTYFEM